MTYPCPHCGAPASDETGCPSCGRGPDADAAEVIRTDAEISALIGDLATARRAVSELETRIGAAWERRNVAAARVRAAVGAHPAPETSTRTVQNVLFVLGGLLLAVAAIVFTAVAWAQFGLAGRATVLGVVTVVALAMPPFALRRGLTATAETVAAVGVLLTLLDGYAARHVNLFGVASVSPARYAGAVCLVAAAVAAGYALATGLTGPRIAAVLVFQPAAPLLVAHAHPGLAGWSLTFGLLAAVDLTARRVLTAPLAYVLAGVATLVAFVPAVIAAGRTVATAQPFFHAAWTAAVPAASWRLPAALALVTVALFLAVPPRLRPAPVAAGATAVAVALPAGLHLPWWNGPILDLVPAAVALALAARHVARRGSVVALVSQLVAVVLLSLHAIAAGFGRPGTAFAVFAVIALLGAGTAVLAPLRGLAVGGLLTAAAAVPAGAWTGTAALGFSEQGQRRAVAVAFGVILVAASATALRTRDRVLAVVVALLAGAGGALAWPAGPVLEAYTLVVGGLAVAGALIARRDHTPSWVTYGPALAVGLLPSLFLVLTDNEQHWRRLLLGLGALAVLLAGAKARLRAPVVAGSVTLGLLALHELVLVWELIPRWIPLAAAGALLVVLAATLERRRRDLARFRRVLGRMT